MVEYPVATSVAETSEDDSILNPRVFVEALPSTRISALTSNAWKLPAASAVARPEIESLSAETVAVPTATPFLYTLTLANFFARSFHPERVRVNPFTVTSREPAVRSTLAIVC